MKLFRICKADIKYHFKKNRAGYISFLLCFFIGLIIGIIIVSSGDSYLSIMTSKNKILYSYISGTGSISELFWNQFYKFLMPLILMLILGLNFYSLLLSFIFITYQSAVFVMSVSALISLYGMSGIMNFLFITLPINLLYLSVLIFYLVTLLERCCKAKTYRDFSYGFDNVFWTKIAGTFGVVILICLISSLVYPLFLKSAIFVIY